MFQAAGSASTIALGSGTIVDIALPSERAGFLGLFTLGPMVNFNVMILVPRLTICPLSQFGPCVGPLLGGVLADRLGWRYSVYLGTVLIIGSPHVLSRAIFWFMCIMTGGCLLFIFL
jgi:MFS family permease